MNFYSEYGEDKWIAENLRLPERGVYVDIGCAGPHQNNNTAFLRDRGWTGVAIDGNPHWASQWGNEFVCAVLAQNHQQKIVPFLIREDAHIAESRISERGENVEAVPLETVLSCFNIGPIDLLSIDIEGSEYDVFQTFDVVRHGWPHVIIAEYATLGPRGGVDEDYRLMKHLLGTGHYTVVHQTVANLIYLRR